MSDYVLTRVYILFPFPFKGTIFIMDPEWKIKNEEGGKRHWDLLNANYYLRSTKKDPNLQTTKTQALRAINQREPISFGGEGIKQASFKLFMP